MLKVTVKKRGKIFKLSNGNTIRTPRIFYVSEDEQVEINSIFTKFRFRENTDYVIENVPTDEVPINMDLIRTEKFSKINNDCSSISLGNKLQHGK